MKKSIVLLICGFAINAVIGNFIRAEAFGDFFSGMSSTMTVSGSDTQDWSAAGGTLRIMSSDKPLLTSYGKLNIESGEIGYYKDFPVLFTEESSGSFKFQIYFSINGYKSINNVPLVYEFDFPGLTSKSSILEDYVAGEVEDFIDYKMNSSWEAPGIDESEDSISFLGFDIHSSSDHKIDLLGEATFSPPLSGDLDFQDPDISPEMGTIYRLAESSYGTIVESMQYVFIKHLTDDPWIYMGK